MLGRIAPTCLCLGSSRPGFFLGTAVLTTLMVLMYVWGIQASLSLGPGGDFPRLRDMLLYALSHDDWPSLLVSAAFLLLVGPCHERRVGTVAFLCLSVLTMAVLPVLYNVVLSVLGTEASRVCGYFAIQLALFTAQCRQVGQRRLLRCLPVWFLPWLLLLLALLLLPSSPAFFHFCAICIGHNYHQSFIGTLQEMEQASVFGSIPDWAWVRTSARLRLPTHTPPQRSFSPSLPVDQAAEFGLWDPSALNLAHRPEPPPAWVMEDSAARSEADLLEDQMLRAGILASLQDAPDAKVEVQKSSVSSLRLQQLEKMGFPTEKAVVALAATKQLDGAISLLIDDSIGEEAVVVSKGKSCPSPQSS